MRCRKLGIDWSLSRGAGKRHVACVIGLLRRLPTVVLLTASLSLTPKWGGFMSSTTSHVKEKIDELAEKAKEATTKAGEAVKDVARNAGEKVEQAGEKAREFGDELKKKE
jgi:F0F1-type ATP synthase membrane subunit b/b'